MNTMKKAYEEAEKRARIRDLERSIDVDTLAREIEKAENQNLRLIRVNPKNRASFAQVISENLRFLLDAEYLSTAELAYIFSLSGFVEMNSNAITKPDGEYMTLSDIAERIHYSVRQVRTLTGSLLEKGVIYEFVDVQSLKRYGRVIEERPLFMNPEIIYSGDRNRINATLCRLVMNADHIEKAKIHLPWKLWLEKNAEYGRLYSRNTWSKKKRGEKR